MKVICLALLLAVGASALPSGKKAHRITDRRIVGGEEANPNEFPWQISFQMNGRHICGGSIIAADTVITAGHCCDAFGGETASIVAGEHSLSEDSGLEQESVVSLNLHEDYSWWTLDNDICLLTLSSPLELNDVAAAIALAPAMSEPSEGDILVASGWGTTSSGGSLPDTLRWVEVPYVNDAECNALIGGVSDSMICAGNVAQGGVDTCQGDSGGPLVDEARSILIGLTSWGYGCADPRSPGVYTQVSYFIDWVEAQRA